MRKILLADKSLVCKNCINKFCKVINKHIINGYMSRFTAPTTDILKKDEN